MPKVQVSSFKTTDYPRDRQLLEFQSMTSSVYDASALHSDQNILVDTQGYYANELMFHCFRCANLRFRRSSKHLTLDKQDFLVLHAQISGEELISMEHGIIRLLPGYIYLRDWSYPFDSQTQNMEIYGVLIPRGQIAFSGLFNRENPVMSWSIEDPSGAMLWQLWKHLFNQLPRLKDSEARPLTQAFIGFLNGLIIPCDAVKDKEKKNRLEKIEYHILSQLRGNITTDSLCDYFHISRATLFRLFKPHGGLKHYIDVKRLDRCFAELKFASPEKTTIGEIAAGWGYEDPKAFNRKFRQQFGTPPSNILGSAKPQTETVEQKLSAKSSAHKTYSNFKNWMEHASRK